MATNVGLPEGFVLDEPTSGGLPDGFVLDSAPQPQPAQQQTNDYIRGMVNTNRQLAEGINRSGQQGKDFRDNVIDAVTGESKMTPEIQGLNSVMSSPEIQSLTGDSFKANWAQLFGNDEDFMLTLRNMGGKMSSDEKGNVIVDLPSGKYALNKPGLDGDDIIPFIANALAFTPAARAETWWGSGLASAATDVGLQGSVSAVGGTDVDPLQTGMSGGIGVGGKIIERGLSGLSRAASGEIAPETQQLLRNAEQNGIDVLTSDVLPPRGLGRQFQQTGEQSIGGTGNRRAIQAEQRRDFVESLPQMIEREFGIYAPHVMQGEVRAGLRAAKDQHGGVINRITEQMGDAALVPNRSVNVLDGAIRQLENRLNPNQNAI
ncbi:injection protein, partial [Providencia rettgeri]|nr:injection protein [Providencia rettgeri]